MKALLVDGLNLIRRIHAAVPGRPESDTPPDDGAWDEFMDGVLRSCRASLRRALDYHAPTHAVVVMEQGGPSWRHREFPPYKDKRQPMPAELHVGLPQFSPAFLEVGVSDFSLAGYEGDDVIATMAARIAEHEGSTVVLTTDRNQCQLLSEHTRIYDHFAGQHLDEEYIQKKYGVRSNQLVDAFALAGDSSLSIPGANSVGLKTAAKLLETWDSLDGVLDNIESIGGKLGENLESAKEAMLLGRKLFALRTDLQLGINLNQFRYVQDG